jgi:hypothetical protein
VLTRQYRRIKIKNVTKNENRRCPSTRIWSMPLEYGSAAPLCPESGADVAVPFAAPPSTARRSFGDGWQWRRSRGGGDSHMGMPVSRATACGGGAACGAGGGRLEQGRRPWGQQRSPFPLALGHVGLLPALAATPEGPAPPGTRDHPFSLQSNRKERFGCRRSSGVRP